MVFPQTPRHCLYFYFILFPEIFFSLTDIFTCSFLNEGSVISCHVLFAGSEVAVTLTPESSRVMVSLSKVNTASVMSERRYKTPLCGVAGVDLIQTESGVGQSHGSRYDAPPRRLLLAAGGTELRGGHRREVGRRRRFKSSRGARTGESRPHESKTRDG